MFLLPRARSRNRLVPVNDVVAFLGAVGGLAAFVTAIGTVLIGLRNGRKTDEAALRAAIAADKAESAAREIILTKDGVFEVGNKIDGRLSELLKVTRELALSEGRAAGISEERGRQVPGT